MKKVLIGFIGYTDIYGGILNNEKTEGPILNCIRNFGPFNYLYLFISTDINNKLNKNKDNLLNCITMLNNKLEVKYYIYTSDPTDDASLTTFLSERLDEIESIHQNDELYVSISGGTPQMQFVSGLLAHASNFDYKLLRVKVPSGGKKADNAEEEPELFSSKDLKPLSIKDERTKLITLNEAISKIELNKIKSYLDKYEYIIIKDILDYQKHLSKEQKNKIKELLDQSINYLNYTDNPSREIMLIHAYTVLEIHSWKEELREFAIKLYTLAYEIGLFVIDDEIFRKLVINGDNYENFLEKYPELKKPKLAQLFLDGKAMLECSNNNEFFFRKQDFCGKRKQYNNYIELNINCLARRIQQKYINNNPRFDVNFSHRISSSRNPIAHTINQIPPEISKLSNRNEFCDIIRETLLFKIDKEIFKIEGINKLNDINNQILKICNGE